MGLRLHFCAAHCGLCPLPQLRLYPRSSLSFGHTSLLDLPLSGVAGRVAHPVLNGLPLRPQTDSSECRPPLPCSPRTGKGNSGFLGWAQDWGSLLPSPPLRTHTVGSLSDHSAFLESKRPWKKTGEMNNVKRCAPWSPGRVASSIQALLTQSPGTACGSPMLSATLLTPVHLQHLPVPRFPSSPSTVRPPHTARGTP